MPAYARGSSFSYIGEDISPAFDLIFLFFCLALALVVIYWAVKGIAAAARFLIVRLLGLLASRREARLSTLAQPSDGWAKQVLAKLRQRKPRVPAPPTDPAWIQVPPWLARSHPLFGLRGWISKYLVWFFVVGSAYALAALVNLRLATQVPAEPQGAAAVTAAAGAAALGAAALMIGILGLFKLRIFPLLATGFTALATIGATAFGLLLEKHFLVWLGAEQVLSFGAMALGTLVPLWIGVVQMRRSPRCRITFWHQLRADHPALAKTLEENRAAAAMAVPAASPAPEAAKAKPGSQEGPREGPHDELVHVRGQLSDLQQLRQLGQISSEEQRERQAMLLDRLTQDAKQLIIKALGAQGPGQPSLGPAE